MHLRKAISLIQYIIANESTEQVKQAYTEKKKELEKRLEDREQNK
jgi:hypothetical protein